ncbi:hypothetical protein [Leifsonia poae]|uniref:hypothetical protein n=1 Tax=Leifsonia poae TaxID=110933 RepID=UPI003D667439
MEDRIPEDGIPDDDEIGELDAGETPGWVDPGDGDVDYALNDPIAEADFADDLVTNDAVGGETIWPGAGGPLGAEPREPSPILDEHDHVLEDNPDEAVLTSDEADEEGI